jgi:predicted HicB family RNase H-like nuclease
MPKDKQPTEALVQLATRIPQDLHRAVKIHCVEQGTSVMEFTAEALETKLKAAQRRG